MSDDLTPMNFIWCDNCLAVRPLVTDELPAPVRGFAARDLICGECKTIVTTLHEGKL